MKPILVTKRRTVQEIDHERTGKRARMERENLGISLRGFAGKMGMSPAYISDLERAKRRWTKDLAKQYKRTLEAVKRSQK